MRRADIQKTKVMGTTQGYVYDESFVADGALAKYRVVVYGAEKQYVKYPAAQDANAIAGITQEATTASGDTVLVRQIGKSKVESAAAISTFGQPLRAYDVVGRVNVQNVAGGTGPWVSGDGVVGYNESTCTASGDIIEAWLGIRTLLG